MEVAGKDSSLWSESMLKEMSQHQVNVFFEYENLVYPIPTALPIKGCDACGCPTRGALCQTCTFDHAVE